MTKIRFSRALITLLAGLLFVLVAQPALAHKDHEKDPAPVAAPSADVPVGDVEPEAHAADLAKPHVHGEHQPVAPAQEEPITFFSWLGRFHSVVVHFPIALLLSAAIAKLLFVRTQQVFFSDAVRFCIWIGAAGALAAAPLGWFFAGIRLVDDEWVMTAHRWTGTATLATALTLLWLSERRYRSGSSSRTRLRVALGVAAALVGATGFLGGSLLYGIDHYVW